MALVFTWTDEPDRHAPKGVRKVLRSPSFPKGSMSPLCADDRLAVCSYSGSRRWEARFWVGYESIKAEAGTRERAMRLLEEELTRHAGSLFGTTDITFSA